MVSSSSISNSSPAATVTGVQLMQGLGVQPARGFWAEAWSNVARRWTARFALAWLAFVGFFAIFSPILASGHPLIFTEVRPDGSILSIRSPLFERLSSADVLILLGGVITPFLVFGVRSLPISRRLSLVLALGLHSASILFIATLMFWLLRESDQPAWRDWISATTRVATIANFEASSGLFHRLLLLTPIALLTVPLTACMVPLATRFRRNMFALVVALSTTVVCSLWWQQSPATFEYHDRLQSGSARAVFTLVPFSPNQRSVTDDLLPPGSTSQVGTAGDRPSHTLGTDSLGQDVLSQLMHACRLSISIGLVSTSIAVVIGVTIGALMGYFGGWVDLILARVVEVFMSVPVLFLLIVAAAVLPKNTYVMMGIIGAVTWTGAARFTRAEFLKLRNLDFVQSAKAVGLPLRSILFRHMLPNGITPVLVDASFAIAAAILAEATLSYLGYGPEEQASWGRLLSDATNSVGDFVWWLAIFPGVAIFLSVLSYNLLGEALRDAIDPKLKKARV